MSTRGRPAGQKNHPRRYRFLPGGIVEIELTKGRVALIDLADLPLVSTSTWSVIKGGRPGSAEYAQAKRDRRRVLLHHLIYGRVQQLDHKNGDTLDCRRSNLRPATHVQNGRNRGADRGNGSGFKGVSRSGRRWRARIKGDGGNITIGYFDTPEEAARAYDSAARNLHGEFARPNFRDS